MISTWDLYRCLIGSKLTPGGYRWTASLRRLGAAQDRLRKLSGIASALVDEDQTYRDSALGAVGEHGE